MLLKLFVLFLKINCLSTSGPASIGLTQKLIVPDLVSQEKFAQMVAISSGIPGSDAVQMAWQTGFAVKGMMGALVCLLAALTPSVVLVSLIMFGLRFIDPAVLAKFFSGVKPALAVMLAFTAYSLLPMNKLAFIPMLIVILSVIMFLIKIPLPIILVFSGFLGLLLI